MSSKRPNVSNGTTTVKDEEREEPTLLSLPDVPLLHVLSYLDIDEMVDAGRASPRLGALTRTCAALWRPRRTRDPMIHGYWSMKDAEGILDVLRVVPPISQFDLAFREDIDPRCLIFGYHVSKLRWCLKTPLAIGLVIIRELGPRLQHLEVCPVSDLHALFDCLQKADCSSLETLHVTFWDAVTSAPWPQGVKLHRLYNLKLCAISWSAAVIEDLKSLLRAHSGQLRSVSLCASLMPLLCECPCDLDRLKVPAVKGQGLAAALEKMRGLKELEVEMSFFSTSTCDRLLTEVVEFLDSDRRGSQLERLVLREPSPETLLALVPDRLAGLQHLELSSLSHFKDWDSGSLGTLRDLRLSRLRSLTLRGFPLSHCEVFADISAASIPALELLLLSSDLNTLEDFEKSAQMFRDLVRGAPMQLHTLLLAGRDESELRICRHPASASGECGLCSEAADILHDGRRDHVPIKVIRHEEVR